MSVASPALATYQFSDVVTSEETLRDLLGQPSQGVIKKSLPALDVHCRSFIALSPFLLLGTSDGAGHADVSPRGDAPGFVLVLDVRTIVIPDRPGNRRIDSLRNILLNDSVGMIFLIPGVEETLRINGRARIVRDADVMEQLTARGKVPLLGIAVEVGEAFLHCAKALKRSRLWEAETWPADDALVSRAQMFLDHVPAPGVTVEQVEASLAESYKKNLY
jgi:PPOX class probable FMN-dependent enzyme